MSRPPPLAVPGRRSSGVLAHLSSLPGPAGNGDIGSAFAFIDWLSDAGQGLWQMLPLNPPDLAGSPYRASSAFAADESLIDLSGLARRGWLLDHELPRATDRDPPRRIDRAQADRRRDCLQLAAQRFEQQASGEEREDFSRFCRDNADWLDDHALFSTIADTAPERAWTDWLMPLRDREPHALQTVERLHADSLRARKFAQWVFERQWLALRAHAHERGVALVGDVPFFVAQHSADVWAHRELFDLQPDGTPRVVAGVPPDDFSASGQLWGNPLYRWEAHAQRRFGWWTARLQHALRFVDLVRIDHFRAFAAHWEVDADARDATHGQWRPGPGAQVFDAARAVIPGLPFIAEDLGTITAEVRSLRDRLRLPGMKVLQFAFGAGPDNEHLTHKHPTNCVVYTGTHDNDTACGWFRSASPQVREHVSRYLGSAEEDVHWQLVREAWRSVASLAICPLQDVLGLGSEHRMNTPGSAEGNWRWRALPGELDEPTARRLHDLSETYGRLTSSTEPAATS